MHRPSLNKQPSFRDLTIGIPARWHLTNDRRNSILMTDLGSASDWLKQISFTLRPIRINTQIWVVKHFCSRFSDDISRGKPVVASRNVGCFLRLTWPSVHPSAFLVTHAESRYFQRNAFRTGCKPSLVMHGTSSNPLFIVDSWEISCLSSTLPSKLVFARLSLTCIWVIPTIWEPRTGYLRRRVTCVL